MKNIITLFIFFFLGMAICAAQPCVVYNTKGSGTQPYGDITHIEIRDENGKSLVLFDNLSHNTGGAPSKNILLNSGKPFDLMANGEYTITLAASDTQARDYSKCWIWLDLNGNDSFESFENIRTSKGEFELIQFKRNFPITIPCFSSAIKSTLRIRSMGIPGWMLNSDACNDLANYGTTYDLEVNLKFDTLSSAIANISGTDYKKRLRYFSAAKPNAKFQYSWAFSNALTTPAQIKTGIEGAAAWDSSGTFSVKLVSSYCHLKDSTTNSVTIGSPTAAPVADFSAPNDSLEIYIKHLFRDNSSNGAHSFDWKFTSPTGTVQTFNTQCVNFEPDEEGWWTVSLEVSNDIGTSARFTKNNLFLCTPPSEYWPKKGGQKTFWNSDSGHIYFIRDPDDWTRNTLIDYFRMIGCNKTYEVSIDFVDFRNNSESLRIYDGYNEAGKLLTTPVGIHRGNQHAFQDSTFFTTTNGIYFTPDNLNNFHYGTAGDTVFLVTWKAKRDTIYPEIELFGPDTIYVAPTTNSTGCYAEIAGSTYKASDKYAGDLTHGVTVSSDLNCSQTGIYHVHFEVRNCENTTKKTRVMIVTKIPFPGMTKVSGTVFFDLDSNGVMGPNDIGVQGVELRDIYSRYNFRTNDSGIYSFYTPQKLATVNMYPPKGWLAKIPGDGVRNWSYPKSDDINMDFAIALKDMTSKPNINLLENSNAPTVRRGFKDSITMVVKNADYIPTDSLDCALYISRKLRDSFLRPYVPYYFSDSLIRFYIPAIGGLRKADIVYSYRVPATYEGDIEYKCNCKIIGKTNEKDTTDNVVKIKKRITNASDPNDKQVYPNGTFTSPGQLLDYYIRFQNTGNAPAGNVAIRDTLSPYLDTNSIELLATSHNCMLQKKNNTLSFYFFNIELPDSGTNEKGSHGFVRFRARALSTLAGNSEIKNRVSIYFDFEKPVVTNTATTRFTPIPRIALLGDAEVYIPVCTTFKETGALAFDTLDGDISSKIKITGGIRYNSIVDDTLVYSVTNSSGYKASAIRIIHKVDNFKPHLHKNGKYLIDQETFHLPVFSAFSDGVSSSDSCMPKPAITRISGANGAVNTSKTGVYTISYFAQDESGNVADENGATINYVVFDSVSPVLFLNTSDTICHPINTAYVSVDASATDNYSTPDKISITRNGTVNSMVKGLYKETFIATDESGNKDTAIRFVKVDDCGPASVARTITNSLKIWPNPTNGEFTIGGLNSGNYTVRMYNIHGQNIQVECYRIGPVISVNAETVTNGLYVLELSSGHINVRKNIIISR